MLCMNCFIQKIIEGQVEGKIDVKGRRERRRKQLPDELKKREDTGDWEIERESTQIILCGQMDLAKAMDLS